MSTTKNINVKWIGGATFIISIEGLKIACDPDLSPKDSIQDYFWFKSRRLEDPVYEITDFDAIDLWLVTHEHEDHLSPTGIDRIEADCPVVGNRAAAKILLQKDKTDITFLRWGQSQEYSLQGFEVRVQAVKAVHGINPLAAWLAGHGNGYLVTISQDKWKAAVYISGDTVYRRGISKSISAEKINLMIPYMGAVQKGSWIGTLTLDTTMLQKFINDLNPDFIMPVHHSTFSHYTEPISHLTELAVNRIFLARPGGERSFPIEG